MGFHFHCDSDKLVKKEPIFYNVGQEHQFFLLSSFLDGNMWKDHFFEENVYYKN